MARGVASYYGAVAGRLRAKRVAPQDGVPTRGSGAQGRMPLAPGSRTGDTSAAVVAPRVVAAAATAATGTAPAAGWGPAAVPTTPDAAVPGAAARVAGEPRTVCHVGTEVVRAHAARGREAGGAAVVAGADELGAVEEEARVAAEGAHAELGPHVLDEEGAGAVPIRRIEARLPPVRPHIRDGVDELVAVLG